MAVNHRYNFCCVFCFCPVLRVKHKALFWLRGYVATWPIALNAVLTNYKATAFARHLRNSVF